MVITEIQLKNFRNLNLSFLPSAGYNLVLGENGSGKSNLLDAIYHLALVKTFKPYSLKNNIDFRTEADFAIISTKMNLDGRSKDLKIVFSASDLGERKRLELNAKPTVRSRFIHNLDVVLFAPHNINLLIGSPDLRREELDDFASVCDYKYAIYIQEFKEIIRNRNRLLKAIFEGKAQESQLGYWDGRMLDLGSYLIAMRILIMNRLRPLILELAEQYFKGELEQLELNYLSKLYEPDPDGPTDLESIRSGVLAKYRHKVNNGREKEINSRQSQYGPHKDDFEILHQGNDLKVFGSRGQQRIATFLLKLAMWYYLAELKKDRPVILLDDLMSELDSRNRSLVEKIITTINTQTFITTTHANDYSPKFRTKMKLLKL